MEERIKELRKALSLTQKQFGDTLNIGQTTITAYECGSRIPPARTIKDICAKFNCNEQWLVNGEGPMFIELSAEDLVDKFLAETKSLPEDAPQRMILHMMAKLPKEYWTVIEDIIDKMLEEKNKATSES